MALLACSTGTTDDRGLPFTTTMMSGSGDGDADGDGDAETGDDPTSGDDQCGDGVVAGDEQCDLGPDNSASAQCTPDCLIASCGDGYMYEGFEECDDGCSDLCECENPPACTMGSDPWTNAPWVVCSSSPDTIAERMQMVRYSV